MTEGDASPGCVGIVVHRGQPHISLTSQRSLSMRSNFLFFLFDVLCKPSTHRFFSQSWCEVIDFETLDKFFPLLTNSKHAHVLLLLSFYPPQPCLNYKIDDVSSF